MRASREVNRESMQIFPRANADMPCCVVLSPATGSPEAAQRNLTQPKQSRDALLVR